MPSCGPRNRSPSIYGHGGLKNKGAHCKHICFNIDREIKWAKLLGKVFLSGPSFEAFKGQIFQNGFAFKKDIIPFRYRNASDLSHIANFLLSGDMGNEDEGLIKIAIKVCKEVSGNYKAQPRHFKRISIPSGLDNYSSRNVEVPKY